MILLKELFDTTLPVTKIESRYPNDTRYTFKTPGGDEYFIVYSRDKEYLIYLFNKDSTPGKIKLHGEPTVVDLEFHKMVCSKYGGNEKVASCKIERSEYYHEIFSTVINTTKMEVKDNEILEFSAEEPSRRKLYDRFMKRLKRPMDEMVIIEKNWVHKYYLIPKDLIEEYIPGTKIL